MTAQEYLTAFDTWLSQHIYAALKSGKDLAYRDRRINCSLKLDEDGSAWDYLLIEPGSLPPPGHAWSVYRLHGVRVVERAPEATPSSPASRGAAERLLGLIEAVFGEGQVRPRPKPHRPVLRLVN